MQHPHLERAGVKEVRKRCSVQKEFEKGKKENQITHTYWDRNNCKYSEPTVTSSKLTGASSPLPLPLSSVPLLSPTVAEESLGNGQMLFVKVAS